MKNDSEDSAKPQPRYFERADPDAKPLSLREIMMVALATHLGVRSSKQRQEDFRRANGFHRKLSRQADTSKLEFSSLFAT